jgi:hypothetical protein
MTTPSFTIDNDPFSTWTGTSVYADKDDPNATNDYRNVDVIVTIGGTVPVGGGVVTLVCIDPENASGTGAANYDGTGIFNGASTVSIGFAHGGPMTQTVTATVGTHAGDNYSILALPSSGEPYVESEEVLTVWRRLWVELDQMAMPDENNPAHGFDPNNKRNGQGQWNYTAPNPEPNDFDVLFQPSKPDISVLTTAMTAACIDVREATPAIITSWGLVPRETTPFVRNTTNYSNHAVPIGNASRDVIVNDVSFWCIQGVGAYEADTNWDWDWNPPATKEEPIQGVAKAQNGIFLLFQEAIRDYAKSGWRDAYIGPLPQTSSNWYNLDYHTIEECRRSASEINQIATFHEVLHFFGFGDKKTNKEQLLPDNSNLYDPAVDGEIMTHEWFYTVTVSPEVLILVPGQIVQIQSYGYPH